jgi:hypothetical protein
MKKGGERPRSGRLQSAGNPRKRDRSRQTEVCRPTRRRRVVVASGRRGGQASDPATRHVLNFVDTSFARVRMLRPSLPHTLAQHDGAVIASGRRGGQASDPATRHVLNFVDTSFARVRMLRPSLPHTLAQHDFIDSPFLNFQSLVFVLMTSLIPAVSASR